MRSLKDSGKKYKSAARQLPRGVIFDSVLSERAF